MRGGHHNNAIDHHAHNDHHSSPSLSVKRRWSVMPDNEDDKDTGLQGISDQHLLSRLLAQPQEQQTKLLRAIAQQLNFGHALFIHSILQNRLLTMPLLDGLPLSVLQQVLKNLDHKTLLSMAKCCREYERIILKRDNDISTDIWSAVVASERDGLADEFAHQMALSAQNITHMTVQDYLNGYKYARAVYRNWTLHLGRTTVVEIPGHRTVTDICADWQSERLFMAADDSIVRVYDYGQGGLHLRGVLSGHQGGVWCMQVVGDVLITGSTDRTIAVWNVRTMTKQVDLIGHSSTIRSLVVFEQFVISGSRDGVIRVWEWASGRCVYTLLGHSGSIRCLEVYKDKRSGESFIISGSYDETAIVWSLRTGKLVHRLCGHSGRIYALAVYKHFVFTAGMDHRVKKWNIQTGELLNDIYTSQTLIGMMCKHGRYLATGSTDGKVVVFDGDQDELLYTIQLDTANSQSAPSITSLSMNDQFLIVTSDSSAIVFALADGTQVHHLLDGAGTVWRGTSTEAVCIVAYQQDDSTRLLCADYRPIVK